MPIFCEDIVESTEKSSYGSAINFVLAHACPNPVTPLGHHWKFEPCFLPLKYKNYGEQLENLEIFSDDVFSISCPKSGSTWTQEIVWLLNNNLNYDKAMDKEIFMRFPNIEFDLFFPRLTLNMLDIVEGMPSPRHLKCHLPAGLLPKQIWTVKPKMIYAARSIKDTAISFYHHYVNLHLYKGSLNDFLDAFLNNRIVYNPNHFHIKDFWFMREEDNVLFLTYEEMKENTMSVLKKIATFLGKSYSDQELVKLEKHVSFDSMKKNASVNFEETISRMKNLANVSNDENSTEHRFIRKGMVGSHKEEMPIEYIERFDKMIEEFNRVNGTCIIP